MTSRIMDALADVDARVREAPHILLCLDVEELLPPAGASAMPVWEPFINLLETCASHPRMSAIMLSERNRAELQARVGIPNLIYVGNLGLEISGHGLLFVEPTAAAASGALAELNKRLAQKLENFPGVLVEDNGLTVCIRVSPALTAAAEEVRRLLHETLASANYPFHLASRANTYEIRPRVAWSKADAVLWIKAQVRPDALVIYISSDEHAEETLAALGGDITIKVGSGETLANYRLDQPTEILPFLTWLSGVTDA